MLDGSLSIVIPTGEVDINNVALKDVPAGVAYKIISISDIPLDRTYRNAWEADMSNPDGYGIGHDAWLELQEGEQDDNN